MSKSIGMSGENYGPRADGEELEYLPQAACPRVIGRRTHEGIGQASGGNGFATAVGASRENRAV